MREYEEETRDWMQRASRREKPFGQTGRRNGIFVLSVVCDDQCTIGEQVQGSGHVLWRVVNDTIRRRRVRMEARCRENRITWDTSDGRVGEQTVVFEGVAERTESRSDLISQYDFNVAFDVSASGVENIESDLGGSTARGLSSFRAIRNGGAGMKRASADDDAPRNGIDWVGLVLEALKGLPGGQVLIGPLAKLRDDKSQASQLAHIGRMLLENRKFSEETLAKMIKVEASIVDTKFIVAMLAALLNEIAERTLDTTRDGAAEEALRSRLRVTELPIPLPRGLLLEEFDALFPSLDQSDEFHRCLEYSGLPVPEGCHSGTEFNAKVVNRITGQPADVVLRLFRCLQEKRAASLILRFCASYLIDKQDCFPAGR